MNARTPGRGPGSGSMGGGGPMGMGRPIEKPKHFKATFKRLLARLLPFKSRLAAVFALAALSTVFTIGAPQITRDAMNRIQDSFMARTVLAKVCTIDSSMTLRLDTAT